MLPQLEKDSSPFAALRAGQQSLQLLRLEEMSVSPTFAGSAPVTHHTTALSSSLNLVEEEAPALDHLQQTASPHRSNPQCALESGNVNAAAESGAEDGTGVNSNHHHLRSPLHPLTPTPTPAPSSSNSEAGTPLRVHGYQGAGSHQRAGEVEGASSRVLLERGPFANRSLEAATLEAVAEMLLQCPICCDYMLPPIFQVRNGRFLKRTACSASC